MKVDKPVIDRTAAMEMVKQHIKTPNLLKHMLAAEAIMRRLAERLNGDTELWGLAGLVHDIDYESTDAAHHGEVGARMLEEAGFPSEVVHAVAAHAEKVPRESDMDKALYAVDPLTGLIVAAALVHPDKKLASLDTSFIMNRFGEKSFARGANRQNIQTCEELGLSLEELISIGLAAMQGISEDLGL